MAISSVGAGAGILTTDVLDKLKAADVAATVTPIDSKITLQKQKNDALNLLDSLLTSFQSNVKALDDDSLYQKRTVSGNNDSVSVTADTGVKVQSMSISDTVMAQKNVVESGAFSSGEDKVASGEGTMTLSLNGEDFTVDYTSSTTLDDLKEAINTVSGGKIIASTLQVGTNDTRLVFTSGSTGTDQKIIIKDSTDGSLVDALKQTDTIKSGLFTASDSLVASGTPPLSGSYEITMNNTTYSVNYDETTTLSQLTDKINTAVGSDVASLKQVGSSYQLLIGSTAEGEDSTFKVNDVGGFLDPKLTADITNNTATEEILKASDASFKYNGITITRPTNTITDIVVGVSINLLKDAGSANINISQNVQAVNDELSSFVTNYNTLTSQLTSMTTSNVDKGTTGIFNGDSSINNITREINKLLTSINSDGLSLSQFGIDLDEKGTMSFNNSTFTTQFMKDTKLSEKFFSGMTTTTSTGGTVTNDGIFTSMSSLIDRYTKTNGIMDTLTSGGKEESTRLTDGKTKAQTLIDARYEAMTARFIQYDVMMTKLTNQFSSLQQQIDMAANGTAS